MEIKTITVEEVEAIHKALVDEFHGTPRAIDPPGTKDAGMLDSAVARQHHGFGGREKYSGVFEKAATLTFGLTCNHPFHNGNKRTAFLSLLLFLERNELTIGEVTYKEIEEVLIWLASHALYVNVEKRIRRHVVNVDERDRDIYTFASWLKQHKRSPLLRGDRALTYHDLNLILQRYGYSLENPKGNSIDIMKQTSTKRFPWSVPIAERKRIDNIGFPGMKRIASIGAVKRVRTICELTNEHKVDSEMFYENASPVPQFIDNYRSLLHSLANK